MTRSLPVASALVAAVWPDPAWQQALRNAVVWPIDERAGPQPEAAGFLAGAHAQRGIGVITLEGESVWLDHTTAALGIPHPVLLPELEAYRDFATELGLDQTLQQLHREVWPKPPAGNAVQVVTTFAGGHFAQLSLAISRARSLGYAIRGGNAVCRLWDERQLLEARFWLGYDAPSSRSTTGNLQWVGRDGQALSLSEVGDVAYSEGMRMAAQIYAARSPEERAA